METKEQLMQRLEEYFSDTLGESDEAIKNGLLSSDEVINCFADALTGWHTYYQETADVYEKLINAVISRYRNK